jgi:hypothetical protein
MPEQAAYFAYPFAGAAKREEQYRHKCKSQDCCIMLYHSPYQDLSNPIISLQRADF